MEFAFNHIKSDNVKVEFLTGGEERTYDIVKN